MSARHRAVVLGLRRGWIEFLLSLRSVQDQGFYLFTGAAAVVYLWVNRDSEVPGTSLTLPVVALPSILGLLVVFSMVVGPMSTLAMEREDGTLLRLKSLPYGMRAYVTGQLVLHSLSLVPLLLAVLVPSVVLFDGVMQSGAAGWLIFTGVLLLGLLATLPIGMVLGSIVPSTQKVFTWGMLPILVITAISGIFSPIQSLWGWVQGLAQVFPVYWLGLGMRSAFLPDAAAAAEIGGEWRSGMTVLVLGTWAVLGAVVAPRVLRRMARRQSGSAMQSARDAALQWVR